MQVKNDVLISPLKISPGMGDFLMIFADRIFKALPSGEGLGGAISSQQYPQLSYRHVCASFQ